MSHVHLTLDILCWHQEPATEEERALAGKPLGLENLGLARRNGLYVRDNLVQADVDLTIREVTITPMQQPPIRSSSKSLRAL